MNTRLPSLDRAPPLPVVHLSLASSGWSLIRAGQAGMALLVAGCLGFAAWCWVESWILGAEAERYAGSLARVQQINRQFTAKLAEDGLTLSEMQISEVYRRVEFANRLSEKRAFSWTRLLSDLEAALPPRVSISSVRLSFQESTVRLQGRVLALPDLNALVDSLEQHGAFWNVKVSKHQFEEIAGRGSTSNRRGTLALTIAGRKGRRQVVQFNLTVAYRPVGPGREGTP